MPKMQKPHIRLQILETLSTTFLYISISILALTGGYLIGITQYEETILKKSFTDMNFKNITENEKIIITGFYTTKGYYCVVTENRTIQEIMETTMHELTHYMNDQQKQHFNIQTEEKCNT